MPVAEPATTSAVVRFGVFEVDLRAGELRKNGSKLKLAGQPFQVLTILLEQPGDVVTREELQKRLWPDTFVDVDHNLNTASTRFAKYWAILPSDRGLSRRCRGEGIDSLASWSRQYFPQKSRFQNQ